MVAVGSGGGVFPKEGTGLQRPPLNGAGEAGSEGVQAVPFPT